MDKIAVIIELTSEIIPDYVELRARIAGKIITANIDEDDLVFLVVDPLVKSYNLAKPLKIVELNIKKQEN